VPNELLMHGLAYWKYNFPIQGTLWMQLLGYVAIGLLVSSLGRRLDALSAGRQLAAQEGGAR